MFLNLAIMMQFVPTADMLTSTCGYLSWDFKFHLLLFIECYLWTHTSTAVITITKPKWVYVNYSLAMFKLYLKYVNTCLNDKTRWVSAIHKTHW